MDIHTSFLSGTTGGSGIAPSGIESSVDSDSTLLSQQISGFQSQIGDALKRVQSRIEQKSFLEAAAAASANKTLLSGPVIGTSPASLTAASPQIEFSQSSDMELFLNKVDPLLKNLDVVHYFKLTGTQLDQWDTLMTNTHDKLAKSQSSVDACEAQITAVFQSKKPDIASLSDLRKALSESKKDMQSVKMDAFFLCKI